MEILNTTPTDVTVRLTRDEAAIINNALNELCNGFNMSDRELELRSGSTREEIRAVLRAIHEAVSTKDA